MTRSDHLRPLLLATGIAALLFGLAAVWYYAAHDLTLSHYDAKAHLVVARRILDSLTPGWRQIGAVWLPLPHVLNALPVQVDSWYQYGTSGVAISVASFVVAVVALVWLVYRLTADVPAALAAAIVVLPQPDLLYLQATPMTEPLLLGLTVGGVVLLARWATAGGSGPAWPAGLVLALACLTRYEAWPVTAAALLVAAVILGSGLETAGPGSGLAIETWQKLRRAVGRTVWVGLWPLGAFLAFVVLSKATVGAWLVTGGFYVAENPADGRPLLALQQVGWGVGRIAGWPAAWLGAAGGIVAVGVGIRQPDRRSWWFVLALAGCAALPFYAFVSGHPFRIRYMVPLVAATAAAVGVLVAVLPRRARWAAVAALLLVMAADRRPLGLNSPMVAEAQWDRANQAERREVTACLREVWRGEPILISMGALAHYMQELSRDGFMLRHFVHEGVGELWYEFLEHPTRHTPVLLVEERAEGGDLFAQRAAAQPDYLAAYERRCAGGGVVLYVRRPDGAIPASAAAGVESGRTQR